MQRRQKTSSAKSSAGDGESGNGDSAGSGDQPNRRPPGDAIAGAAKASSCRQQALSGHAGYVRTRRDQFLAQLEQLRSSVQQVADAMVRARNLKNEMLTLQDENVQLQMALNRELRKAETLWNATEERKRPPGMSPPRPAPRASLQHAGHSQHGAHPAPPAALPFYMDDVINMDVGRNASPFLQLMMPWNVNENDIPDLEDFEEDLQQYIAYRGSSPIENYIGGYSALSSVLSFGEAVEALGANPVTHAQRFQWQDEHRQRQQAESQLQGHPQTRPREQEQQQAERQAAREQRQQQAQFLPQQQRSFFGYTRSRRYEQLATARTAVTYENHDAEQEQRAGHDRASRCDDVTDSNRRGGSKAGNLEYEQLPLD
ncbi:hypothetical protein MTO96_042836 [Rhipicephalus appendiculatus]